MKQKIVSASKLIKSRAVKPKSKGDTTPKRILVPRKSIISTTVNDEYYGDEISSSMSENNNDSNEYETHANDTS